MKKIISITISIFIGTIALVYFVGIPKYRDWNNSAHYHARLRYDGHDILKEIQSLQKVYFEQNKTYASSIKELVKNFPNASYRLKENPEGFPGLVTENHYSGSAYFYSIESADSKGYIGQARFCGFASYGEDIWQIKESGNPYPIKKSKFYSKK